MVSGEAVSWPWARGRRRRWVASEWPRRPGHSLACSVRSPPCPGCCRGSSPPRLQLQREDEAVRWKEAVVLWFHLADFVVGIYAKLLICTSSSNMDRLSSATFKKLVFTGALTRAPSAWDSDFYDSLMGWLINCTLQNLMIYSTLNINVFPFRESSASKSSSCSFLGKYFVLFTFHIILWFHLLVWPTKSSLSIVFPAVAHRQVEPESVVLFHCRHFDCF